MLIVRPAGAGFIKGHFGTFKTCRTLQEAKQTAGHLHVSSNKLTQTQLSAVAKGVNTHPVVNIAEHKVDATHERINFGLFHYKLLTREMTLN